MVAVIVFNGEVSARPRSWLAAIAIVVIAGAAQFVLAPARVDEGHNVFLPRGPGDVLERGLPADVYRHMQSTFDAVYPPSVRCQPDSLGCWQSLGFPDAVYSFSADGIWHKTDASRSVTTLDFSDPVWLRLGFINDLRYNWFTAAPDVHRADRDRRFWMGLSRWHLTMPWYRNAAPAGGLCRRRTVLARRRDVGRRGRRVRHHARHRLPDHCAGRRWPQRLRHRHQAGHSGDDTDAAMERAAASVCGDCAGARRACLP